MTAGLRTGNRTRKPLRLIELKDQGHQLIDRLVLDGVTREKVYRRLARRLNVREPFAHFSRINTVQEAERAVESLTQWLQDRIQSRIANAAPKLDKVSKRARDVLPRAQQLKAYRMLRRRKSAWWKPWYSARDRVTLTWCKIKEML